MSKFKVRDKVMSLATGEIGTVRARTVITENESSIVEYMVDFGGPMASWKVMERGMLKKVPKENKQKREDSVKVYDLGGGKKLTMVGIVSNKYFTMDDYDRDILFGMNFIKKGKELCIGFSLYNGTDEYDQSVGIKIAKHRAKKNPFCQMSSTFSSEFNVQTVEAIMDAKAEYIRNHIDEFYRPR